MVSEALVSNMQERLFLTQVSVEDTWRLIREARGLIAFDLAEKLRLQASHVLQSQQCQHQRTHCQQQRAALQSQRARCALTSTVSAHSPKTGADACGASSPSPDAPAASSAHELRNEIVAGSEPA